jgi:outer membrane lipoprotein-sorting protein
MLYLTAGIQAQENQITQDPAAGQVLERVAQKTQSMKSIQADFELVIEDRKEKTKMTSAGKLLARQNKYRISSQESTVLFDGTTMWTYLSGPNEVTITQPETRSGDFMSNPASFFTFYKRDFKYRYVRETVINGTRCHEIDLFPNNLNQPYSRIKVFVGIPSDLPEIISSIGKDGVDFTVYLKNIVLDRNVSEESFKFDATQYKKVEIVDMRGLE